MYNKYPDNNEGFFSRKKSKIVSRENLNKIGKKIIPTELINHKLKTISENIYGNIIEAIIGAVYLEKGHEKTKKLITTHILKEKSLYTEKTNYKSKVLEWSQKNKRKIEFIKQKQEGPDHDRKYLINLLLDGKKIADSWGKTIKSAEQNSAKRACKIITPQVT